MVQRPLRRLSDRNTATRVSLGDALITPYRLAELLWQQGRETKLPLLPDTPVVQTVFPALAADLFYLIPICTKSIDRTPV